MLKLFNRSTLINEKDLKLFDWFYQTYHLTVRDIFDIGINEGVCTRVLIKQLRAYYRENCKFK